MNEYFLKADNLIREAMLKLNILLGQDGEDLSYQNPIAIDIALDELITARSYMAVGRYIDDNGITEQEIKK